MLEAVEVLRGGRRSLRRAVSVECHALSGYWDEPVPLLALDLSPDGMWIDAALPLEVGDALTLRFMPPRWRAARPMVVNAEVRRVNLRLGAQRGAGMGIAFVDLRPWERDALRLAMEGLPPPLPAERADQRQELLWVDSVLTWEEELDDRINIFEVSELLGVDDEFETLELEFFAIGEILSSPKKRSWLLAA